MGELDAVVPWASLCALIEPHYPSDERGVIVLPRRWVVERSFAWLGCSRRLAKNFEATIASAEAWVLLASIRLITRRLARP